MDPKIQNVGVVGAGLIGASWAAFYAAKGLSVKLCDVDAVAARNGLYRAIAHLQFLKEHNLLDGGDLDAATRRVTVAATVAECVSGAELVQECVAERYDVKKAIFTEMERHAAREAVLASSSSMLLISEIQEALQFPERSLIAHPFNPPHLIPLVELVPGKRTDPALIPRMKEFFAGLGKTPVVLKKEVIGHVANRLQAALWREAVDLVARGVASVEDVDRALSAGPGLRYALMGQHLIFHLGGGEGGIEHFMDHIGYSLIWKEIGAWHELPPGAREALIAGISEEMGDRQIADVAHWRDEKIVELLKLLHQGEKR